MERTTEVVARVETSASAATGATAPPAGGNTADPQAPGEAASAFSGDDPPGAPDQLGEDGEGPREPSGRRTKVLLAVAGVAAVLLVVLPLVLHSSGSDDAENAAASPSTGITSAPPSPGSGLIGVPKDMKTASDAPTKHAATTTGPVTADSPAVASHRAAGPGSGTRTPNKATTTAPSSQPTTVVVKPLAKLAHGAPWKTSRMQLGMQTDGNLVLYDLVGKRPLWAAGTSGAGNTAYFQTDGNLVVYTADHHAIWASDASGFTDATLVLRSDGNMLIMAGTKQVWSTNTHF